MKLLPVGEPCGIIFPDVLFQIRKSLAHAINVDDLALLSQYFALWMQFAIHHENSHSAPRYQSMQFVWNVGSSPLMRFESACAAYALGRCQFHLRRYHEAYKTFGCCLEEVMQVREDGKFPLQASIVAAFRLRCCLRSQRHSICHEISEELSWEEMLSRSIWLDVALSVYKSLGGTKEPLECGPALIATARSFAFHYSEDVRAALLWEDNPFRADLQRLDTTHPSISRMDESVVGVFDWARFVSSTPFSR